jgi:hypothetical protein
LRLEVGVTPYFHHYLFEKEYRKRIDLSGKDKEKWAERYDEKEVSQKSAEIPMTKWVGSSEELLFFSGEREGEFKMNFSVLQQDVETVYR